MLTISRLLTTIYQLLTSGKISKGLSKLDLIRLEETEFGEIRINSLV